MTFTRAALLAVLVSSAATAATPVPPFPEDGTVAVRDVPDVYSHLREFLRTHNSPVGAKYHVAVVAFSDAHNRPGPEYGDAPGFQYIDRVSNEWAPNVDPNVGVVIVMALENRDILVHPFARWTQLGWEQGEIKKTIDNSRFTTLARAGAYADALIALIGDIDVALAQREQAAANAVVLQREAISQLRARAGTFDHRVKRAGYDPEEGRKLITLALMRLEQAAPAITPTNVSRTEALLREAQDAIEEAEDLVARMVAHDEQSRRLSAYVREELTKLRAEISAAEWPAADAADRADKAEQLLEESAQLLAAKDPIRAWNRADWARALSADGRAVFEAAKASHEYRTKTVPRTVASLCALAALILLVVLYRRSGARRMEAKALLDEWEGLLRTAGDNVVRLLDAHALFLGHKDLVGRFTGKSLPPVRAAAGHVDDFLLLYDGAQRLLETARKTFAAGGITARFREGPYAKVTALLTRDELVARTEDVTERTLFLPDRREVRMNPQALLKELELRFAEASRSLTRLQEQFARAWEQIEATRAAEAELDRVHDALLPHLAGPSPFDEDVAALDGACARIDAEGSTDPLGQAEEAAALSDRIAALRARVERARDAAVRVRETVADRVAEAEALISALRSEGLRVHEPGFEPQSMLLHTSRAADAAMDAVRSGEDERALEASVDALDTASELGALLSRTRASKNESPSRIQRARSRLESLRMRLPDRKERLLALRAVHADSALQPALDNVEEALPALSDAEACLADAELALSLDQQRYLHAAQQVARAEALLEAVERLFAEIDDKAHELSLRRARAEAALQAAAGAEAEVAQLLSANDVFATDRTLESHKKLQVVLASLTQRAGEERPDWVALCDTAEQAATGARALVERARREQTTWKEALALAPELDTRRKAYAELLSARTEDRDATNVQFRASTAELETAHSLAKSPRPDWHAVVLSLRKAAAGLEATKQMAERDFADAASARAAIATANKAVQSANRHYRHGVRADTGNAKQALARAQALIAEQKYAEAEKEAMKASRAAKDAEDRATDLVLSIENAQNSPSDWEPNSIFSIHRSTSSSSWGSSSSRSSFGSSRSSFGSSSGGSSFRSSSGGSSFRSSSGGSKW